MICSYDYFNRLEEPVLMLCNSNDKELGIIENYDNLKGSFIFDETSEISLDIYKYINNVELPIYNLIQNNRQILVGETGYFIIAEVDEVDNDGENPYKSIKALSCEIELSNIQLSYFNGTYKLYDESNPNNSLMGEIFSQIPHWNIGHVDSTITNLYRTFEEPDNNVYNFLVSDVQEAYGCLIIFNPLTRVINIYDKNNYINETSILLTKDDVLKSIKMRTGTDNVFTSLKVEGADNLTIHEVNPLGTDTLYNFSYFKNIDDMDQDLIDAVNEWENKLQQAEESFQSVNLQIVTKMGELQILEAELNELEIAKKNYIRQRDAMISDGIKNLSSINSQIDANQSSINQKKSQINSKKSEINSLDNQRNTIHNNVNFQNNFSDEQYSKLLRVIKTATYKNENIIITEGMTFEGEQQQRLELLKLAKEILKDVSTPTYEFSVETSGFIFNKYFESYVEQLEIGHLINVEMSSGEIGSFILLKIDVDYHNKTISLTFGNRFNLIDSSNFFDKENRTAKTNAEVQYKRKAWDDAKVKSQLSFNFIQEPLDLTKNSILGADGQRVEITDTGYTGRSVDSTTGELTPYEIKITSNTIAFTNDNWDTSNMAIGRLILPSGEVYGVIGEAIIGNIVVSKYLHIRNENSSFVVDENGVYIEALENVSDRLQQAEQKVTPNAIVSTVRESNAYQNDLNEKANQSDVNALSSRVSNAESTITQHSDQIAARVTTTTYNAGIADAKAHADARVDGIEIGGRNLLRSSFISSWGSTLSFTRDGNKYLYSTSGASAGIGFSASMFEKNKEYVLSFKVKKTSGDITTLAGHSSLFKRSKVYRNGNLISENNFSTGIGVNNYPNDDIMHEYIIYFETNEMNATDNNLYLQPNRSHYGLAYSVEFLELKIESGNKATDWTPAPEDVQGQIDQQGTRLSSAESTITQHANQIASKVSQTEYNADRNGIITRLDSAESNITQHANQIQQRVTQTEVNNSISGALRYPDTRHDNRDPSWYWSNYPRRTIEEFKFRTVIGAPGSSTYGLLETVVPWSDSTGGPIIQTFMSNDGNYQRRSTSGTTWSAWIQIETTIGSQAKVDSLNTTEIVPLKTRVSNAESTITQHSDQIAARVTTTDYNGNTIASLINQTATTVAINASKINLTGYITATNLSTAGSSTINGSNITTGILQSSNYVANTSGTRIDLSTGVIDTRGFKVNSNGDVQAITGTIAGFNFSDNASTGGMRSISDGKMIRISPISSMVAVEDGGGTNTNFGAIDLGNNSSGSMRSLIHMRTDGYMRLGRFDITGSSIRFNDYVRSGGTNTIMYTQNFQIGVNGEVECTRINGGEPVTALNIATGQVSITPAVANAHYSVGFNFGKTFSTAPRVNVTCQSTVVGTTVLGFGISQITTTGFILTMYRTNTTTTNFHWTAIQI